MDFFADFIAIKPGCLERACDILTQIFHRGPNEGEYGERRWRIVKKDINWYSSAEHQPQVAILAFDWEKRRIYECLKEQGLVA